MRTLYIKQGDTHDLELVVKGTALPEDLSGYDATVLVRSLAAETATEAEAAVSGQTVTYALDGTLAVGTYALSVRLTSGDVVRTAPSKDYVRMVVQAPSGAGPR